MSLARRAKIVRWHLISPRILASAANEINYHGPLSLSREPQRPTSPGGGEGTGGKKRYESNEKHGGRSRRAGDALI